jgi:hypothetical protein
MLKGPDVIEPEGATVVEGAGGVGASAGCAAERPAAIGRPQAQRLKAGRLIRNGAYPKNMYLPVLISEELRVQWRRRG